MWIIDWRVSGPIESDNVLKPAGPYCIQWPKTIVEKVSRRFFFFQPLTVALDHDKRSIRSSGQIMGD